MHFIRGLRHRRVALAAIAIFAVAGGVAYAAIPDAGSGVYHACMLKNVGTIRIIDPERQRCSSSLEVEITFNKEGPTGNPGATGPRLPGSPAETVGTGGTARRSRARSRVRTASTRSASPTPASFSQARDRRSISPAPGCRCGAPVTSRSRVARPSSPRLEPECRSMAPRWVCRARGTSHFMRPAVCRSPGPDPIRRSTSRAPGWGFKASRTSRF